MELRIGGFRDLIPRHEFDIELNYDCAKLAQTIEALLDNDRLMRPLENTPRFIGTVRAEGFSIQRRATTTYLPLISGQCSCTAGGCRVRIQTRAREAYFGPVLILSCIGLGMVYGQGFFWFSLLLVLAHVGGCFTYAKEVNTFLDAAGLR